MRKTLKFSSIIGVFVFGISNPALAADLDKLISLPSAPTVKPVEVGNGWYLRGDISYVARKKDNTPSFNTYSAANGYRAGTVTTSSFDDQVGVGGGIGYNFTDLIRADATIDYLHGNFSKNGTGLDTCATWTPGNTTCSYNINGAYKSYMALANAYVDLATISGFTPYVGGGVGFTKVTYDNVNSTGTCVAGAGGCGTVQPVSYAHGARSEWRNTWAVMAGVSYDLENSLKLDLGYRYSKVAGGDAYGYGSNATLAGATGVQGKDGGFDRHEIRLGMRLSTW